MNDKKYVLKLDGDYYAGPNQKYSDMFNIAGRGVLGAKRLTKEEANRLKDAFEKNGFDAVVEEYDARQYMEEALSKIIMYDQERQRGKDCGYAIENLAKDCLEFLVQI